MDHHAEGLAMSLTHLLACLEQFLDGQSSLEAVEEWVVTHLQSILDSGDCFAIELANEVDADLVEFRDATIDEAGLRVRFQRYVGMGRTRSFVFPEITIPHAAVETGDAGRIITEQVGVPGTVETIQLDQGLVQV
mgnify:CR=1 FL=1